MSDSVGQQIEPNGRDLAGEVFAPNGEHDGMGPGEGPMLSERVQALRLEKGRGTGKRPRRRKWFWLLVLAALGTGGWYAYQHYIDGGLGTPRNVQAVVVVRQRPLDVVLDTTGYVIAHSVVKVHSRIPGRVVELGADEGRQIKKGDVLVRLDDDQYRADLDQAKAALASAEAQLAELRNRARPEEIRKAQAALQQAEAHHELTDKELKRAAGIRDVLAPSEYDRIVSTRAQAAANVDQARQSLRLIELGAREERVAVAAADVENAKALVAKAQFFYDNTRIHSPIDGTVLQRNIEPGELVRTEGLIGGLCTIADLGRMEAEIDIQERDLAAVHPGQACQVTTDAYPDRQYTGLVEWFAPTYNRQRGVRRVKVAITKPDEFLAPDMNCRVKILGQLTLESQRDIILLPPEAVVDYQGRKTVMVAEDHVAQRRGVEVGKTFSGQLEIRRGLSTGEIVIVPDERPIEEGQYVRPIVAQKKEK